MFKRLRERIAEEATKFPVGQHAFGNSPGKLMSNPNARPTTENSTEDLITLSDSSSVVPLSSPQQFSIAEDEDGSASEQNTPQKRLANSSAGSEQFFTPNSSGSEPSNSLSMEATNIFSNYQPSKGPPYVPQSDIESEVEEPPTLNLDGISKEQLLTTNQMLKARLCKYKFKYQEVVKAYKDVNDVKKKIEHALIESQDKGLRRIAELREQCQLEQKAKAHLEENLRLILEEKDSRISVLETQINLLKEGQSEGIGQSSGTQFCKDIVSNEEVAVPGSTDEIANESTVLNEKIKKLQALLVECKNSILGKSAQITQLTSEKDSLVRELEIKVKEVENFQDNEAKLQSAHDVQLKSLRSRLTELEQQQGESSMSMAETKKNMHEELELKERQLNKAKEEARQFQLAVDHEKAVIAELKKQHEDRVNELQTQLANTEKAMEDEKESLMKDLSRGKAEGVLLMQQEYAKKLATAEEDWKNKLREMTLNEKAWKSKEEELLNKLQQKEDELLANQQNIGEHKAIIEELKCEKQDLIKSSEDFKNKQLETEKDQAAKCAEDKLSTAETNYKNQITELKGCITQLKAQIVDLEQENREKITALQNEFKTQLNKNISELSSKLKTKDKELEMQREKSEKEKKEQIAKAHILQESVKDKENIITQLKSSMSSLESVNVSKVEDLNKRIKQLEHEREQLMLQAQERVAATDSKCREDIKQLKEKIHELQSQNKEIEKLRNDIILLNSQLDESLLVAEANQAANSQEISVMKSQLTESQEKLTAAIKTHSTKEVQLESKIQELQDENATLLFQNKCIENLKQEKTDLNEIIKTLENKIACSANLEDEVRLLKSQNEQLHSELDTLVTLKKEKDQLNLKIRSLELAKKDLSETVKLLKFENESLKKSPMQGAIASPQSAELALLKEENEALKKKILILEQIDIKDPVNSSLKQYIDIVRKECEEKISVSEAEMEGKFKNLIKKFSTQMDVKDYACDQLVSEVFEKNENQEGKLQREHRIEIAALRQDIFEKDCALEEMHEHYEGIIQEKEAKIKECEKNLLSTNPPSKSGASSGIPGQDASDWDDTWVVPEESCESSSPFHSGKVECETHLQQIETMQEELAKCNSEIKDLRILLRLSPPQSLASNNNYSHSSTHLPEPTEFEYLRNILFEYMMGKETVTLAKVIAAVLKFNEEQTRLVIQKEESKHAMK